MEKWVPINDFPEYEVSDEGRIRNIKTGRIMKSSVNSRGYSQVCLRSNKQQYTKRVHRLVADAFHDKDRNDLDVNHIDGNKQNNKMSNLEFCSRKENIEHAYRTGLKEEPRKTKVRIIETGEVYDSLVACRKAIGGDRCQIHRCLIGKEKSCKGFHFEPAD